MKKFLTALSLLLVVFMTAAVLAGCSGETPAAQTTDGTSTKAQDSTTTAGETADTKADETSDTEPEQTEDTEPEATTEEEEETDPVVIANDVIQIGTREQLFAWAEKVIDEDEDYSDMTIMLTADINLDPTIEGGKNWTPISTTVLSDATIDGQGHVINGMTVTPDDLEVTGSNGAVYGSGFIGIANASITIKNIVFTNAKIESDSKHCGTVVASVEGAGTLVELDHVIVSGLVLNGGVGVEGDITGISIRVGGLIGANIEGGEIDVHDCEISNSQIFGFHNIGAVIGCTNEGTYNVENNKVTDTQLNYSAAYNESYQEAKYARYFADPFYSVNNFWGEYHTDFDKNNGNTLSGLDSYDIRNDIHYTDEEGKNADSEGIEQDGKIYFPVIKKTTDSGVIYTSQIRPVEERNY